MAAVERNEAAFNAVVAKLGRALHRSLRRTCPAAVVGEGGLVIDDGLTTTMPDMRALGDEAGDCRWALLRQKE